jgi:hypothetical protein
VSIFSAISEYGFEQLGYYAFWQEFFIPRKFKKNWLVLDCAWPLLDRK